MSYNKSLDFLNMIKNGPSATTRKTAPAGVTSTTRKAEHTGTTSNTSKSDHANTTPNTQKENDTVATSTPTKADLEGTDSKGEAKKAAKTSPLTRTISRHNPDRKIAVIDTETNWENEVMSIGIVLADMDTFKCVDAKYYVIDPEYRKGGMYSDVLNIVKSIPTIVTSRDAAMQDICNYLSSNSTSHIFAYNARFDFGHLTELCDFDWFDIMRLAAYKQYNHAIPSGAEICKSGRLKRGYSVECILQMLSGDYGYHETHNAVFDAMDELKIMELLGHNLDTYACAKL